MAAPKDRFPSIVSLQRSFRGHVCSGMLISRRFILTAAHCLDDPLGLNPLVAVGAYHVDSDRWTVDDNDRVKVKYIFRLKGLCDSLMKTLVDISGHQVSNAHKQAYCFAVLYPCCYPNSEDFLKRTH